jgi:glycerol kinase
MNLKSLQWDPALLSIFNVPLSVLPKIVSSAEVYGLIKSGPLVNIPVAGCLGDQQAALVGQKCFEKVN